MTYWIGTKAAIDAACATADARAVEVPETRDGETLPRDEWITERWAEPAETATLGVWAIPVYPRMRTPVGCERVDEVEFPALPNIADRS